jgi:hypothetical protein
MTGGELQIESWGWKVYIFTLGRESHFENGGCTEALDETWGRQLWNWRKEDDKLKV